MVRRRHVLGEIRDIAPGWVRAAQLNGSRPGRRIVYRVGAIKVKAQVPDVIGLDHRVGHDLLLNAEVPVFIAAFLEMRVGGTEVGRHSEASERLAEKEIRERAIRSEEHTSELQSRFGI